MKKTPRLKNKKELKIEFKEELNQIYEEIREKQEEGKLPTRSKDGTQSPGYALTFSPNLSYPEKATIEILVCLEQRSSLITGYISPTFLLSKILQVPKERLLTTKRKPLNEDLGCVLITLMVAVGLIIKSIIS